MRTTIQNFRSAAIASTAVVLAASAALWAGATPAAAASASWSYSVGGDTAASGGYTDSGNWLHVADEDNDTHSAVIVAWKPTSDDDNEQCWNPDGKGTNAKCRLPASVASNGQEFYAKLCIGEYAGHRLLQCGAVHHVYA